MRFVIPLLLCSSLAAGAADAGGVWTLDYTTGNGLKRQSKLDLKVEGDLVRISAVSRTGSEFAP